MINIHIEKKDLWLLAAIVVFLVGVAYVIAYGGNQPSVHGHSAGEIAIQTAQAVGTTGISTSSTTLVDMPDMSVTVNTNGGNLFINFAAPVYTSGAGNRGVVAAIIIDGVEKVRTLTQRPDPTVYGALSSSLTWLETNVPAGPHTIKVQWATTDSGYPANQAGATYKRVLNVVEL